MLMLVLTLTLLFITPIVVLKTQHFSTGAKKDPVLFIINLVTKML
jgi:hypothetical protein